jgi:hypothetical protein
LQLVRRAATLKEKSIRKIKGTQMVKMQPSQSTRCHGSDEIDKHWGDAIFDEADQGGLTVNAQPKAKYGGRLEGVTIIPVLVDENGSSNMAIDVSFTGVRDKVHDGIDTTAWTGSAISGIWTFDSSDHAKQGVVTVLDYTALAGKIITIQGTKSVGDPIDSVLTEGGDWTAETSNDATAVTIQGAIDAIEGVSATVSGSIVTVTANNSVTQADITTLSTDALLADMTASAQSVDTSETAADEEALFKRSSSIDMSNYEAISFNVLIEKWDITKGNEITLRARLAGVDVGSSISISDSINETLLGVWQAVGISKSEFGISDDLIDEFVIKTISNASGAPNAPKAYIDVLQIEEAGAPRTFIFEPPPGTQFKFQKNEASYQANSNATSLDPDEFITIPKLPNGLITILTKDGATAVATALRDNFDLQMGVGGTSFLEFYNTGSKVWGKFVYDVGKNSDFGAVILRSSRGDKLEVRVSDNLSGLTKFNIRLVGQLMAEV